MSLGLSEQEIQEILRNARENINTSPGAVASNQDAVTVMSNLYWALGDAIQDIIIKSNERITQQLRLRGLLSGD